MDLIFDILAALHPDRGCSIYKIKEKNGEPDEVRLFANFPPRRGIEDKWTETFLAFQMKYCKYEAKLKMVDIMKDQPYIILYIV